MLVRILVISIGCWWSAVSLANTECQIQDELSFTEDGDNGWCYKPANRNKVCIQELKGLVPVADHYLYCGGSWQSQLPNQSQHGQHPSNPGQVPDPHTGQTPPITGPGSISTGGGNAGSEGSIQLSP